MTSIALPPDWTLVDERACIDEIVRTHMVADEPVFFSRIGGSDTDFVFKLLYSGDDAQHDPVVLSAFDLAKRYNGFYEREPSGTGMLRYAQTLDRCYRNQDYLFAVGGKLLTQLFPDMINAAFREVEPAFTSAFDRFCRSGDNRPKTIFPYTYMEHFEPSLSPLFMLFQTVLTGKRVLVVSPFARSIELNFQRRHRFFKDYSYPDFELRLLNSPITYSGLPSAFYPDEDWFATVERMQREVARIDFDVALLCCGSYAMPVGSFIKDELRRKAIYVGGILQLFFGLLGRRYDNEFFLRRMNVEEFIRPVEGQAILPHAHIDATSAKEALGAYF